MGNLSLREGKSQAQKHTAKRWQRQHQIGNFWAWVLTVRTQFPVSIQYLL